MRITGPPIVAEIEIEAHTLAAPRALSTHS